MFLSKEGACCQESRLNQACAVDFWRQWELVVLCTAKISADFGRNFTCNSLPVIGLIRFGITSYTGIASLKQRSILSHDF